MRDYDALFRGGVRYTWASGSQCETEIVEAGYLDLPTGKVVIADPDWAISPLEETDAVAAIAAPGRYPISLLVASWEKAPEPGLPPMKKVCASKLRISDDPVVEWRPAFPSASTDDGDEVGAFGISVDSGTASFFDFSAREWLAGFLSDDDRWRAIADDLRRSLYVSFQDQRTSANVVIYECGMGDGVYGVWLGLNLASQVSQVLVDLELLSHSAGVVD